MKRRLILLVFCASCGCGDKKPRTIADAAPRPALQQLKHDLDKQADQDQKRLDDMAERPLKEE